MEVILRTDVPKLGKAGDIVKVKDGFARNYLLPKGLAIPAIKRPSKPWKTKERLSLLRLKGNEKKLKALRRSLLGLLLPFIVRL